MKRYIFFLVVAVMVLTATAQEKKTTTIEFEKTTIDLGKFGQEDPVKECFFVFKNTGNKKLYIHSVSPACGCTSRRFPTHAIEPGASDTIFITYNGEGKSPRKFRTSITVHSNTTPEMTTLIIKGEMLPAKVKEVPIIEVEE